eukprot:CAMPEP_0183298272 /NCGR_PEP_ID=MMETSP0160_2-20130417/5342_1 /TAXON_ID=2839 ORGANISM="Odontella Sinensis, Strain Grunow 1884" /NCGR_SAMPLE_ID=MMETSP0160_2 /ASSEMBLY_ACC=CAM_ASM_000250 /LENGTH=737 /DNA_ID=CAMNT_0025460279 /DNA_START=1 /DNA_END=2214 /DNA_ORIENTATION=+
MKGIQGSSATCSLIFAALSCLSAQAVAISMQEAAFSLPKKLNSWARPGRSDRQRCGLNQKVIEKWKLEPRILTHKGLSLSSGSSRLIRLSATSIQSAEGGKYHGKDREKELARLAKNLNVNDETLKEVLKKKSLELDANSDKARYVKWLLSGDTEQKSPRMRKVTKTRQNTSGGRQNKMAEGQIETRRVATTERRDKALDEMNLLTDSHFAQRKDLHPASKRALDRMGMERMTEIQAKTFAAAAIGRDVLGRARTGTGKTLAFLLPAIERVLQNENFQRGSQVGVLVISPTRELATQIGDQAEQLLTFHKDLNVQVVYGGTKLGRDVGRFKMGLPAVLVATPGRLLDHLESTIIKGQKFGDDIMSNTPVVVLDEADRLLDMGFQREIRKILSYLPRGQNRQTLLFSATIPPELKSIMADTMKDDFIEVDCINDGDGATHTNSQVQQSHVIIPSMDRYVSSVVEIVSLYVKENGNKSKTVVFFPTARQVAFFAEFFNVGLGIPVMELHSRKTQGYRNRVSNQFRDASSGILFTSDVSARGVDYPGVSQVLQFGIPESREQYIHRLGRTGRAGKAGKGCIVLAPFESLFLEELKGLDIPKDQELADLLSVPIPSDIEEMMGPAMARVGSGDKILTPCASGAYQAFLGYYLGKMKKLKMKQKEDLVEIANQYSYLMGLREIPSMTKNMVGKMGLKGVEGVVVRAATSGEEFRKGRGETGGRKGHLDGRRGPNPRSPSRKK